MFTVPYPFPPLSSQHRNSDRHPPIHSTHPCLPLLELCRHTTEFAQIHSKLIKLGLIHNPLFFTRLMAFCSIQPSADTSYARSLFDRDKNPNPFAYNVMIRGYSQDTNPEAALALFHDMLCNENTKPNSLTFPFVLKACSSLNAVEEGTQVHGLVYKYGFVTNLFVQNALILMYMRSGSPSSALNVFGEMSHRDVVSWNSVVSGLANLGLIRHAQEVFDGMPERSAVSWNSLIDGYVKSGLVGTARGLFDQMPAKNVITWNIIIGGYVGSSLMEEAHELFIRMPLDMKDLTTFTVMIDGYVKDCKFKEVLQLFREILALKIKPNSFVLVSVLSACSRLMALEQGEWVHAYINRNRIRMDVVLGTALMDMYGKCGRIDRALVVFHGMEERDIGTWNSVIANLGIHGYGKDALELFFKMLEADNIPDEISFLSVLSACRHSGLIEEGRRCFYLMSEVYNIAPKAEHYGCMVDLLCRAGLLSEAKELIEANDTVFGVPMWGSLLGASSRLGNIEMGEYAAKHLLELDPNDARIYVTLSNMYSMGYKWDAAIEVRVQMRNSRMEKVPGCSSIQVDGVIHEFLVGTGLDTLDELV